MPPTIQNKHNRRDRAKILDGAGEQSKGLVTFDVNNATRYYSAVIRSFRDKETKKVFRRSVSRRLPQQLQRAALRRLLILDAAESLDDLRVPPGNRLERLSGKRSGQYSIRINRQWRICFLWKDGDALEVEIVDYH
jgi:proteic killer suppression protein